MRHHLKEKLRSVSQAMAVPVSYGFLIIATAASSGCRPKNMSMADSEVKNADNFRDGGYFSQVIGHMKDHGMQKLQQVAMDPATQAKLAEYTCRQLPEAQRAKCFGGLVTIGKVTQGVGTALGAEIKEAQTALQNTMEDPQALVAGVVQIGESAISDPNYLKNQALSLGDDAKNCAETMRTAMKTGDFKTVAEGMTHIGLLLVPVGKVAKVAKVAEETSIAAHAAEFAARVKVTTNTIKGTGCTGTVNSDGSLSTTLTVETPLLSPNAKTIEVY